MSWFFPVSKAFAFLALPSHVLLWLVAGAALATVAGWRAARGLALAALALFVVLGMVPTGLMLAKPLEDLHPRRPLPAHIDGIVILGGGLGTPALVTRGAPGTGKSLERIVSAFELARRHPEAKVVFTGGWGQYADAIAARAYLLGMGLEPGRLVLEDRSRNTYENIAFTRALVNPKPGETWVLATSAIQLSRAARIADKAGWPMIPWPTDYKTTQPLDLGGAWWRIGDNIGAADDAFHEWVGMAAYRAAGLAGKRAVSTPPG